MKVAFVIGSNFCLKCPGNAVGRKTLREQAISNGQQDQLEVSGKGSRPMIFHVHHELGWQQDVAIISTRITGRAEDLFLVATDQGGQVRNAGPDLKNGLPYW